MDVRFETDSDGFLSQECPQCLRRFKILFGEGAESPLSFCPYCRRAGDDWLTQEQLAYVTSVATEVVLHPQLEELNRQATRWSGGVIDLKVVENAAEATIPPVETTDDFDLICFACCSEKIKAEQQRRHYCVICGREQEATMSETRIFLSHRGSDKKMVLEYKEILEDLGYSPWLDEEAMPAGTSLERGLLDGMRESCAVVFFVTRDFKDEGFLKTEIDHALTEKGRRDDGFAIITLVFGESEGGASVPPSLRRFVWKTPKSQFQALKEIRRGLPKGLRNALPDARVELDVTEDALSILKAAAEGDGHVMCSRTLGGIRIYAGSESMMDSEGPREAARWQAAVDELQRHRFIKGIGHKGEVFELTKAGWDMADSL